MAVPEPLNPVTSDVSPDSFRLSWTHTAHDVLLYKLAWVPLDGGDSQEVSYNTKSELWSNCSMTARVQ